MNEDEGLCDDQGEKRTATTSFGDVDHYVQSKAGSDGGAEEQVCDHVFLDCIIIYAEETRGWLCVCVCVHAYTCTGSNLKLTARVRQSFLMVRFTGMSVKQRVTVKCIFIKKEVKIK